MAQVRKNQFSAYKAYFDEWEAEIQKKHRVQPLYPAGFNVQERPATTRKNNEVAPLLPVGVSANRKQSFQTEDPATKVRLTKMPGIRGGSLKIPLESIAQKISEKLLEHSENYPKNTGSALELTEVQENGIFLYNEFYMGEKSRRWGNWVQEDNQHVRISIDGKSLV